MAAQIEIRRSLRVPGLLVIVLLLGSVTGFAKTVELDERDADTQICLRPGDILKIRLKSNPTTGYSWAEAERLPWLKQISDTLSQEKSGKVGAGGYQVFTFKVGQTGEGRLTLNYFRPFEKNKPPVRTFRVSVSSAEETSAAKP